MHSQDRVDREIYKLCASKASQVGKLTGPVSLTRSASEKQTDNDPLLADVDELSVSPIFCVNGYCIPLNVLPGIGFVIKVAQSV